MSCLGGVPEKSLFGGSYFHVEGRLVVGAMLSREGVDKGGSSARQNRPQYHTPNAIVLTPISFLRTCKLLLNALGCFDAVGMG